ncbi:hypothetical protein EYF80_021215 [Liparis tanakae]|uniref:Uncharacterized protein n=1 Tax=Liparis tanakae TaxID=230148 RepID=A0A4Z2HRU6_9TELE|nr:hypothetical protein EYF80_021215 [Liparis tanakae]
MAAWATRRRRLSRSDTPLRDNTVSRHAASAEALKRPQPLDVFDVADETPTTGSEKKRRREKERDKINEKNTS